MHQQVNSAGASNKAEKQAVAEKDTHEELSPVRGRRRSTQGRNAFPASV